MTEEDLLSLLRDRAYEAGSLTRYARAHGFTVQYLSEVLARTRRPGPKILKALGYKKVVEYFFK